jgi:hypothetical protein
MGLLNRIRVADWTGILYFGCAFFGFYLTLAIPVLLYAPNRLFTVPFRAVTLGISLYFIFRAFTGSRSVYRGFLLPVYIAWMAFYAVRLIAYSQERTSTLHGQYEYLIMGIGMCLLPGLGFLHVWHTHRLRVALHTVAFVGATAGWLYCWIYAAAIFSGGYGRLKGGQFVGDYVTVNPLQLGYMGSGLVVLAFALLRSNFRGLLKWFALPLVIAPGVLLISFSGSRGPVIALLGCFVIYIFANLKQGGLLRVMVATSLGACFLTAGIWFMIATDSALFIRFINTFYGLTEGGDAMSRFELYEMAWQQFLNGPVFGDFVELRGAYIYPHNFFLEALISTGIVGFILFSTLVLGTCILAFRLMRQYSKYGWVSLLYFHYFIYSMVSSALYSNTYFWCSLGLVLGVWQSARYGFINSDVSGNHQNVR